jgi:hypothetical protein
MRKFLFVLLLALVAPSAAGAGCAKVTSSDATLRVYPSAKAQIVARLQTGDLVDTDLKAHCQSDAFETREVCDRDGNWVKIERVWRKEDLLEIAGWAGKKRLQSLSIPDVEGRKMSKAEESEAGCARE